MWYRMKEDTRTLFCDGTKHTSRMYQATIGSLSRHVTHVHLNQVFLATSLRSFRRYPNLSDSSKEQHAAA